MDQEVARGSAHTQLAFSLSLVSSVQAPSPWGGGVHIQAKSFAHQLILPAAPSQTGPAAFLGLLGESKPDGSG